MPTREWLLEFGLDEDKIMTVFALLLTQFKGCEFYLSKKDMIIILFSEGGGQLKLVGEKKIMFCFEDDFVGEDDLTLCSPLERSESSSSSASSSSSSSSSSSASPSSSASSASIVSSTVSSSPTEVVERAFKNWSVVKKPKSANPRE